MRATLNISPPAVLNLSPRLMTTLPTLSWGRRVFRLSAVCRTALGEGFDEADTLLEFGVPSSCRDGAEGMSMQQRNAFSAVANIVAKCLRRMGFDPGLGMGAPSWFPSKACWA